MSGHDRDPLPIPDFDHLTTGALETRVRALTEAQVRELLDHERGHAARVVVLTLLERRLEALAAGAEPTGGDPTAPDPSSAPWSAAGAPATGSAVGPQTEGPPVNPPSQGVPTNPAQPRH